MSRIEVGDDHSTPSGLAIPKYTNRNSSRNIKKGEATAILRGIDRAVVLVR